MGKTPESIGDKMRPWDDRDFSGTPIDFRVARRFVWTSQGYFEMRRISSPEQALERKKVARRKRLAREKARAWMEACGFPWVLEDDS